MPGADADVLVLDPELEWEVDPARLVTAAGWSPYAGRRLRGRVIAAFSRGVQVWDGREVLSPPGHGRFVAATTARATAASRTCLSDARPALPRLAPGGDPAPAREQPGDRRGPRAPGRLRRPRQGGPGPRRASRRSSPRCASSPTARRWSCSRASRSRSCPPGPRAPAVLLANGNLVGRWATPETFYELERRNLIAWGGLTAGCWQYIGSQGVLQGTYETFAQVAREHFGGSLAGRLVVTAGLGGMGSAQPVAITRMLGGVWLVAEVDGDKARRRLTTGSSTSVYEHLDEALDAALRRPRGPPRARDRARRATPPSCSRDCWRARSYPDVVTDLTAAHDLRSGYLPAGHQPRRGRRAASRRSGQARGAGARHPRAPRAGDARSCASAARSCSTTATTSAPTRPRGGVPEALTIDIFTARYLRPLFCRGIGPFRWICLSGEDADLERRRRAVPGAVRRRRADRALDRARARSTSPARACRPGSPGSATASARGWRWPSTRRSPTGACAPRSPSPATTWTAAR